MKGKGTFEEVRNVHCPTNTLQILNSSTRESHILKRLIWGLRQQLAATKMEIVLSIRSDHKEDSRRIFVNIHCPIIVFVPISILYIQKMSTGVTAQTNQGLNSAPKAGTEELQSLLFARSVRFFQTELY